MSGLRNAVRLWVDPATGRAWATNMGRDTLGDDLPPETLYEVVDGADAGWQRLSTRIQPSRWRTPSRSSTPDLPHGDVTDLHQQLRIGPERILHPPQSDINVESRGVRYHLIGDVDKVYLVATSSG
jgi:hypothetical protein